MAQARSAIDMIVSGSETPGSRTITKSLPYETAPKGGNLECVPYARALSGVQIYGDAHTWWKKAEGRYARGHVPRVGAVLALRPHGNSTLGHVAAVSRIVDSRTILLSHANWSYPGKIEKDVTALDVSPNNDWSEVRIWYAPSQALGASKWPVAGFIYNAKPGSLPQLGQTRLARGTEATSDKVVHTVARSSPPSHRPDKIGALIAAAY